MSQSQVSVFKLDFDLQNRTALRCPAKLKKEVGLTFYSENIDPEKTEGTEIQSFLISCKTSNFAVVSVMTMIAPSVSYPQYFLTGLLFAAARKFTQTNSGHGIIPCIYLWIYLPKFEMFAPPLYNGDEWSFLCNHRKVLGTHCCRIFQMHCSEQYFICANKS